MADIILDGDFSIATLCGAMLDFAPVEGVSTKYAFTQKFCQQYSSYTPLAVGTAHPTRTDFYLVKESPLDHVGGGIVTWDRVYCQIPAQHNEPSSISYDFIGLYGLIGGVNVISITGRERFTQRVPCRIQYDYFRLGVAPYTTILDVPILAAQKYYYGMDSNLRTDFLSDSPPFESATNPSRTTYEGWISGGTEIVAEDSNLERFMGGNIVVRRTPYVKAI